jgi:hypothetical protein
MDATRSAISTIARWLDWLPDPLVGLIVLLLAAGIALSVHKSVRRLVWQLLEKRYPYLLSVFTQMRGVTQLGLLILAMIIAVPVAPFHSDTTAWLTRVLVVAIVCLIGWAAITSLHIAGNYYLSRFRMDVADNLLARKHNTQVRVLMTCW